MPKNIIGSFRQDRREVETPIRNPRGVEGRLEGSDVAIDFISGQSKALDMYLRRSFVIDSFDSTTAKESRKSSSLVIPTFHFEQKH